MNEISYRNLYFPSSIIQRTVGLYARFNLSLRDVEELMAERGVKVSYETVRRWVKRFSPPIARGLRRGRPRAHPQWHRERSLPINGGPMRQHFVICASTPRITRRSGRTIASKDRTFAFADENVPCKAFDLLGAAQRFLSIHAAVYNHFTTRRHLISAAEHRQRRDQAFTEWRIATCTAA